MNSMVTVPRISCSSEMISRREIINWINSTLNLEYKKIEDLTSGAAYCLLMNLIQPASISPKKLKVETKLEHEILLNYKALQNAFRKCGIDKEISIANLMKGRFQDHLLFAQWFKRFYDANMEKRKTESNLESKTTSKVSASDLQESTQATSNSTLKQISQNQFSYTNGVSTELIGLKSEYNKMKDEYKEDQQTINDLSRERQFYYDKLCRIEALCNRYEKTAYSRLISKFQEILFKEEDGFVAPVSQENEVK